MNLIRTILLAGSLFYTGLFIIEFIQGHILWQAVIGTGILLFIGLLPFSRDEKVIHEKEMIILWICILLFGLYAILKSGGII